MMRHFLVGASAILLFGGLAAGVVAWLTQDAPPAWPLREAPPTLPSPAPAGPFLPELPAEPAERERTLEDNAARVRFDELRRGFASQERSRASEGRLAPALEKLFPRHSPPWTLECRRLLCRLEVLAPASVWRERLSGAAQVRRHADRVTFDPDGEHLAFVELVEAAVAGGPPRPEGSRLLDELERELLASEQARRCLAEGPAPRGVEVRLMIDRSGITHRFGAGTDPKVATCLSMEALPDVLGAVSAPAGVQAAERTVRLPPPP